MKSHSQGHGVQSVQVKMVSKPPRCEIQLTFPRGQGFPPMHNSQKKTFTKIIWSNLLLQGEVRGSFIMDPDLVHELGCKQELQVHF